MSDDQEVTIAGRAFRLGAVYAPRPGMCGRKPAPRRLLAYTADSLLPGGRVTAERVAERLRLRPGDVPPIAAGRVGLAKTAWRRLLREIER